MISLTQKLSGNTVNIWKNCLNLNWGYQYSKSEVLIIFLKIFCMFLMWELNKFTLQLLLSKVRGLTDLKSDIFFRTKNAFLTESFYNLLAWFCFSGRLQLLQKFISTPNNSTHLNPRFIWKNLFQFLCWCFC